MGRDDETKRDETAPGRRDFLKAAALGGVGAAAAAVTTAGESDAAETPAQQLEARYRLNEHVKRFYFLNRL